MKKRKKAELNTPAPAGASLLWPALKMLAVLLVLIPAVMAYLSTAWFSTNVDTNETGSGVTSKIIPGALYIAPGDTVPAPDAPLYQNTTPLATALTGDLYPISTPDCDSWYCVRRDMNAWDTVTYRAVTYEKVLDWTEDPGVYESTVQDRVDRMTAYNLAVYVLYTDPDTTLDVYLQESEPVAVTAADPAAAQGLLDALRIGIVVDDNKNGRADPGELRLVYAPTAESGVGNSAGAAAGENGTYYYYCIDQTGDVPALARAPYPVADPGTVAAYCPTGTALCTVSGETGTVIRVYIWLEGTDAQAVVGSSDDVDSGISVQLGFTGVQ